jgi:hypothetical protein
MPIARFRCLRNPTPTSGSFVSSALAAAHLLVGKPPDSFDIQAVAFIYG